MTTTLRDNGEINSGGSTDRSTPKWIDNKLKVAATLAIAAIIGFSFVIYFVVQTRSNQDIRSALFDQHNELQTQYTSSMSQNIASDLKFLMDRLETLSASRSIQGGQLSGNETHLVLKQMYLESTKVSLVEGLYLLDKKGVITDYYFDSHSSPADFSGIKSIVGYNASESPPVIEAMQNLPNATFSNAYKNAQNDGSSAMKISLVYPIYDFDSGQYLGAAVMDLDVRSFLAKYGNLDDPNLQYLTVLDKNATIISSPFKDLIGKNVFGAYSTQGRSQPAIDQYRTVISGHPSSALYSYRTGERLNTGEPVLVNGVPVYFAFVVTPTASIYAQINSVLSTQEAEVYGLLVGVAAATALAAFFLLKWNSTLEKAVRERTASLRQANEKLITQEKLQSEFINVAAHELRTPITPILFGLDIMHEHETQDNMVPPIHKQGYEMVVRNAKRLKRLSDEILDVARIESGNFKLNVEELEFEKIISDSIKAHSVNSIAEKNIRIEFEGGAGRITVMADRERLVEVLDNLINNAIKFTPAQGKITIKTTIACEGHANYVKVSISDSGSGLDPDILPRLFTKFATNSEHGTGLGLFISKSIIEAHGGIITGENNKSGIGATFSFTLPLPKR